MKKPALVMSAFIRDKRSVRGGFSLPELLTVLAIVGIICSITVPALSSLYGSCCLKAAIFELCDMLKEAKQSALSNGGDYAITFDTAKGLIALVSGKGADNKWNTSDDPVVRSFLLRSKGGGLRFGYGNYGPIKGLEEAPDGVTFQTNNTCVCNPELTGNAGTVYIMSAKGAAMALKMNSTAYGYFLYRWDGKQWVRM